MDDGERAADARDRGLVVVALSGDLRGIALFVFGG